MPEKVNIAQKFTLFNDTWSPKIVGEVNDSHVKVVKLDGEFVWHHHEHEDEMFLVIKGELLMQMRDKDVTLQEGEFIIIPRGVEHRPVAVTDECHVLLFEPRSTVNTGSAADDSRTVSDLDQI